MSLHKQILFTTRILKIKSMEKVLANRNKMVSIFAKKVIS